MICVVYFERYLKEVFLLLVIKHLEQCKKDACKVANHINEMKSHLQELTTLRETKSIVTILQLRIWGKFLTNLFDLSRIKTTMVKTKCTMNLKDVKVFS